MSTQGFRMDRFNISEGGSQEGDAAPKRDAQNPGLAQDRSPVAVGAGEGRPKKPRGFARLDQRLLAEISRRGGKAAHLAGTAHEFTSEEARIAGRKGGRAPHEPRRDRLDEPRDAPAREP